VARGLWVRRARARAAVAPPGCGVLRSPAVTHSDCAPALGFAAWLVAAGQCGVLRSGVWVALLLRPPCCLLLPASLALPMCCWSHVCPLPGRGCAGGLVLGCRGAPSWACRGTAGGCAVCFVFALQVVPAVWTCLTAVVCAQGGVEMRWCGVLRALCVPSVPLWGCTMLRVPRRPRRLSLPGSGSDGAELTFGHCWQVVRGPPLPSGSAASKAARTVTPRTSHRELPAFLWSSECAQARAPSHSPKS
jgi:hypothetical protein